MSTINYLVDKYADHLYGWASYKVSDEETAKDLVQDTFLAAIKGIENFQNKSNHKTWLTSILNNKIADYYRKSFKTPEVNQSSLVNDQQLNIDDKLFDGTDSWKSNTAPTDWHEDEFSLLDNPEFNLIFKSCIEGLPEKWSIAVQMKYIDGRDGNEICQDLDVTSTNFWQIIRRAKLKLRECLENNWFKN